MGGAIMGGLPLYVEGIPSTLLIAALGIALAAMAGMVVWHWRGIGDQRARCLFAMGAAAPGLGLLILGAVFNNTPIEVRYLSFAMPFVGLLLAGALTAPMAGGVLAVQAVSIAGLLLAPQTMQPARAAARKSHHANLQFS